VAIDPPQFDVIVALYGGGATFRASATAFDVPRSEPKAAERAARSLAARCRRLPDPAAA